MYNHTLLNSLSGEQERLRHRLKPVEFRHGDSLLEAGAPVQHVIFLRSGLVSTVVDLSDGEHIEVGMVGADGAIGAGAAVTTASISCTGFVHVPVQAWAMKREDAVEIANESAEFRRLLYLEERWAEAQAQQIAACNAKHTIVQRLCSWLLRANDVLGGSELLITQEHLAQMLGVQRASISLVASRLQEQGLVEYRRGRVRIVHDDELAQHACECHGALRQKRELLLGCDAPTVTAQSELARSRLTAALHEDSGAFH